MTRVERAGGSKDDEISRLNTDHLRDRDGRWFGVFPAHWTPPPVGRGEAQREAWMRHNIRDGSTGTTPAGSRGEATTGSQARAVLAAHQARDDQHALAQWELDHWHEPPAVLARAARRALWLAQYAELLAKRDGPGL